MVELKPIKKIFYPNLVTKPVEEEVVENSELEVIEGIVVSTQLEEWGYQDKYSGLIIRINGCERNLSWLYPEKDTKIEPSGRKIEILKGQKIKGHYKRKEEIGSEKLLLKAFEIYDGNGNLVMRVLSPSCRVVE